MNKRYKANAKDYNLKRRQPEASDIELLQNLFVEWKEATDLMTTAKEQITAIEKILQEHTDTEKELRTLKTEIKTTKERRDELVGMAREKITEAEAEQLILVRWQQVLNDTVHVYIQQYQRNLRTHLERIWDKYTVTLTDILNEREKEQTLLNNFLMELGYE